MKHAERGSTVSCRDGRWRRGAAGRVLLVALVALVAAIRATSQAAAASKGEECLECHRGVTKGIVAQWQSSKHSQMGIDCLSCHQAEKGDSDAMSHEGATIAVIVSPKDCARCHEKEYREQMGSHHARAGEILGSLDNLLGEVVGGEPAVAAGCRQCHGGEVKVDAQGRPTTDTWPNTGMGRSNPDGSRGSCAACHARHEFSVAQARQPEACGKCHLGPDHPQLEVWNESKHGILYHANRERMKLDSQPWRAGEEYFVGPTCASCHMGAAGGLGTTHDVGERISWTLRPPISVKLNMVIYEDDSKEDTTGEAPALPQVGSETRNTKGEVKKVKAVLNWQQRRARMQEVCGQCHAASFVKGSYLQMDAVVDLYDEKFGKPGKAIMDELKKAGKISQADFDDPIEWTWYEIWHHQGRRARHGAAMQGPDYTWWHGIYEVAKGFYMELIPQVKEVAGEEMAKELMDKYLYNQPGHLWLRDGMSKDALKKIEEFYKNRYQE